MHGRYTDRVPLHPSIASRLESLREIAARYGLRSVSVVGSAVTGEFEPARSDLDLLVDFGEYSPDLGRRATGFHRDVEALFGRRVDVISVHGLRSRRWREIHAEHGMPVYAAA
jgi:predicted nucleotidyltransferase